MTFAWRPFKDVHAGRTLSPALGELTPLLTRTVE
jgi:hypothetical protein